MGILADMLSFSFICRALVVGIFVALCAALLGVSMVLKRYAMIGDGLSHVSFGALSVALAFGFAPLKLAIPVADYRKRKSEERCCDCSGFGFFFGNWYYCNFSKNRNQYGCVQLHVRQHSGNDTGRCVVECHALCCGIDFGCILLS